MASVQDSGLCARCHEKADLKCSGCLDAPEYMPADAKQVIVYCSRECQTAHWPRHKAPCSRMRKRKKLLRAARLLKSVLLTYRACVFDVDITRIELKDGVRLLLHQNLRSDQARTPYAPFPEGLTGKAAHREAALANNQCTTALALFGRLTAKLLSGFVSSVENFDLNIAKPLVRTQLVPGPDSRGCPHSVLKVCIHENAEEWVVDPAGCQYGFRRVLSPFGQYAREQQVSVLPRLQPYDWNETTDLAFFDSIPGMNITKAQRENRAVKRKIRLHFASFVDQYFGNGSVGTGKTLLEGTEAVFSAGRETHHQRVI
ncbi:hypothetical protein GGR56DRAFT_530271 [Xylariaceae sp. FL0804]|nr:hypothetical protein GGR56DRAFT_530271 [Xylariaceae sp. FL0804]